MQVDTSWKRVLYLWSPELLAFHMNSIHDTLPSPANLKLWGKTNLGLCQLCNHQHCTLFHILNGCKHFFDNGRYNWRHDQTLRAIAEGLLPYITMPTQACHVSPAKEMFQQLISKQKKERHTENNLCCYRVLHQFKF